MTTNDANEAIYRHRWDGRELKKVEAVWRVLVDDFFQPMIGRTDRVLDIGCGFCHFLNHVSAESRTGVDANPAAARFAGSGVRFISTSDLSMAELNGEQFDFVFLSNFLEHLNSSDDVLRLLRRIRKLISSSGRLVILQPNFRLLGSRYFDFIDHKTILTDANLQEALECTGFSVSRKIVRFLPYTTKSRLPLNPWLVRAYLRFPIAQHILGKQSLFVAVPVNELQRGAV
jgi:SAM-dependent methyltransferase